MKTVKKGESEQWFLGWREKGVPKFKAAVLEQYYFHVNDFHRLDGADNSGCHSSSHVLLLESLLTMPFIYGLLFWTPLTEVLCYCCCYSTWWCLHWFGKTLPFGQFGGRKQRTNHIKEDFFSDLSGTHPASALLFFSPPCPCCAQAQWGQSGLYQRNKHQEWGTIALPDMLWSCVAFCESAEFNRASWPRVTSLLLTKVTELAGGRS